VNLIENYIHELQEEKKQRTNWNAKEQRLLDSIIQDYYMLNAYHGERLAKQYELVKQRTLKSAANWFKLTME